MTRCSILCSMRSSSRAGAHRRSTPERRRSTPRSTIWGCVTASSSITAASPPISDPARLLSLCLSLCLCLCLRVRLHPSSNHCLLRRSEQVVTVALRGGRTHMRPTQAEKTCVESVWNRAGPGKSLEGCRVSSETRQGIAFRLPPMRPARIQVWAGRSPSGRTTAELSAASLYSHRRHRLSGEQRSESGAQGGLGC